MEFLFKNRIYVISQQFLNRLSKADNINGKWVTIAGNHVFISKDRKIMYSKKPGEWSIDDCKGVLHDEYKWSSIKDMPDDELKLIVKEKKEKVIKEKDFKSPFYKMSENEIFNKLKNKMTSK